ncbi:hypothetical protein [Streptomyces sp. NRRL F-5630]|uniref:hypothetical protein n=1 Tax=Streptomyces sp. NRRL F-5630 TaxID=1463864 RepID=UPI003D74BA42
MLLALAAVLSAVLSGVASAAPEPPSPALPTGPAQYPADPLHPDAPPLPGRDAPTGDDLVKETEKREKKEAAEKEKAWERLVAKYRAGHEGRGGILDSFKVKDPSGKMLPISDADGNPISSYRIYADSGSWKDWDLKIEAFLVEACFTGIKFLVGFACFLISWGLSFSLAGLLLKPARLVSDSLYGNVLVQMGVPALALTFAATVAAWQLMLGNRSRGWGNLVASMVISALAVGALASPPELLLSKDTGAVATARNLAVETAALVLEKEAIETDRSARDDSASGQQVRLSPEALARPITDALVDSLIARPAMMLSYGRTFDGNCGKEFRKSRLKQAIFDEVLDAQIDHGDKVGTEAVPFIGDTLQSFFERTGIHVTPDFFREKRKGETPIAAFEKKCVPDATAVKRTSMDKVVSAAFMLLAAAIICLFILFLDFGFLVAQVQIALEAMLAKVALVAGVLPGDGRAWLWTRAASIARSLALMVVSVLCLAVVIVLINAITTASEKDIPGGITIRFVLLDGVCIAAFAFRKRLIRSTRAAADRARTRLGSTALGGASTTPEAGPAQQRRRSPVGALLTGGLMAAAALGTGGTSAAAGLGLSRMGTARTGIRLGGAALRAGTATAKGLGRAAGTTAAAGTRLGVRAGAVGLKSTIGLPVYGPRAARQLRTGARALPGRLVQQVNTVAHRAHTARVRARTATAPARAFVGEYRHNIRSLGRVMRGQGGLGPYTPAAPLAATRRAVRPPARSQPRPPAPRKQPAPAPPAATPRPRLAPPRSTAHERPQSAAQGMLQARLHRAQARRATPPPPAPSATPPRRAVPPAAPRRPRS